MIYTWLVGYQNLLLLQLPTWLLSSKKQQQQNEIEIDGFAFEKPPILEIANRTESIRTASMTCQSVYWYWCVCVFVLVGKAFFYWLVLLNILFNTPTLYPS